jgi:tetratricopeptide (TPR) repeat protein
MQIRHKIDDFLLTLFKNFDKNNHGQIVSLFESFYSFGSHKPKVTIEGGWIIVDIDTPALLNQEADYKKVVALCEKGNFKEAKRLLKPLIEKNPSNSEYHRIYGQILSDEGDQEEAINSLIDALRWDPKNGYALLMMGNIYAKFKDDITTAMKYYDQAVKVNPEDNIAVNNIGANLLQQGKMEEAKTYFWEALKINDSYPNTHFGLAMVAEMENDFPSAFYSAIQALKKSKSRDYVYQNSFRLAFKAAQNIIKAGGAKPILNEYLHKLEFEGKVEIESIPDNTIPTSAKIEFAENYKRDKHIIRFKPNEPAIEHLEMHELVHLDFVLQAREISANKLFITNGEVKRKFILSIETTIKRLKKEGVSEDNISNFVTALFEGINRQIFNTPIDLFIEDYLYNEFADLRPYQFFSLLKIVTDGQKAVTDKQAVEYTPKAILTASKVLNMVVAIHFKDLFGVDLINDFKASPIELKQAQAFFEEFLEYRDDRSPGEEYELVSHWGDDLKLNYYDLVDENTFRNVNNDVDALLTSIENDPFDLQSDRTFKDKQTETFLKSQEAIGLNMAVVMFMVDAMQYFKKLSPAKVKEIALEIAMVGTQGINPAPGHSYKLANIPNKDFSGYHLLAYYYVSWSQAIPEMLDKLNLPFAKEFDLAKTIYKNEG